MKITTESVFPDFELVPAFAQPVRVSAYADRPTVLLFLRYYGCTICRLDIRELTQKYKLFEQKGAKIAVVLQSEKQLVETETADARLPFDILCDPDMLMYKELEIMPAKNKLGLVSLGTIKKMNAAKKAGLEHGAYEGDENQLPAVFILGPDLKVTFAHYAKNLGDMPTFEELAAKL